MLFVYIFVNEYMRGISHSMKSPKKRTILFGDKRDKKTNKTKESNKAKEIKKDERDKGDKEAITNYK